MKQSLLTLLLCNYWHTIKSANFNVVVKVVGRTDKLQLRYNRKDAVNARIEIKIYHPIMNLSQHKMLNPRIVIEKERPKACNYCY